MPANRRLGRAAALVLSVLALGAGCSDGGGTASETTAPPATTAASAVAIVHFLDDRGRLVAERRRVSAPLDPRVALEALQEGPRRPGLAPAFPPGNNVLGVAVAGGTATVDLDAAFEEGYPSGGAAAETAVLAPIVYTLTGVSGVLRVLITVEGRTPMPPGTQFDLSRPLTRGDLPVAVVAPR